MQCLVVIAHPLADSLNASLAKTAVQELESAGHQVRLQDLYQSGFAPALTAAELRSHGSQFDATSLRSEIENLLWAEAIVLVFPTWWFGFPAILKGWFDRVWAPGIAYDQVDGVAAIKPRLDRLRSAVAITTQGAPWWVDRLVMRQPVKRVLKTSILQLCAPACRLQFLTFYSCEKLSPTAVEGMKAKIARLLQKI